MDVRIALLIMDGLVVIKLDNILYVLNAHKIVKIAF